MKERNLILNKKIITETVETIIDSIYEKTEEYMEKYGELTETHDEFYENREEYILEVIKELSRRVGDTE